MYEIKCTSITNSELERKESECNSWIFFNNLPCKSVCVSGQGRFGPSGTRCILKLSFSNTEVPNPSRYRFQRRWRVAIHSNQVISYFRCLVPKFPSRESIESASFFRKVHFFVHSQKVGSLWNATKNYMPSIIYKVAFVTKQKCRILFKHLILVPNSTFLAPTLFTVITFWSPLVYVEFHGINFFRKITNAPFKWKVSSAILFFSSQFAGFKGNKATISNCCLMHKYILWIYTWPMIKDKFN